MTRELRDREHAEGWLMAGLCLGHFALPSLQENLQVAAWLIDVASESGHLPPPGVVADIGHLITSGSLQKLPSLPNMNLESRLAEAVYAYEDHVLGRLDADPRLTAVTDALARLPALKRDHAIALFCSHFLAKLDAEHAVSISPGIIRRVAQAPIDELTARGFVLLGQESEITEALTLAYSDIATSVRRLGALISETDIFVIEHYEALGELSQRLAIEQIVECASELGDALPRRLKPRRVSERGQIPTLLDAEDKYPTGGFASLSTSGSFENLVTSELIYMEPPASQRTPSGRDTIDLFDLRYAEGELLYYTRDESVFIRHHKRIVFALLPDLATVRFKDPSLRYQRLVLVLAVLLCSVRRLASWLEGEGLRIRVAFIADADDALAAERKLCAILLRDWLTSELCELDVAPSLGAELTAAGESASRAETTLIAITAAAPDGMEPPPGVLCATLSLAEVEPALVWAHHNRPSFGQKAAPPMEGRMESSDNAGADAGSGAPPEAFDLWRAWIVATLELLQELI